MSGFVIEPNLPVNADKLIIGRKYYSRIAEALKANGFSPIALPDNPNVDRRISGHADISILHVGENRLFLADYLKNSSLVNDLAKCGADLRFIKAVQSAEYPKDAQLNMCLLGKRLIYNKKYSSKEISDFLSDSQSVSLLKVKQGYARCSVCIVDDGSIITADKGIATAAENDGLDVLRISPGFVELDGFGYGFIGGSAFKLKRDLIAFTGHLENHPDAEKITSFIHARSVDILYLTDESIFDIGGAVPLTEK